eukprot:TRINITY_DN2688_c0_g1_i2.p1 TRINITY_DN2688_c0_g1~~TRINITY_DN2688_c0_g1_i2.p1  ORF type:complete len:337 (-),score=82.51 TRINITY_DN2688_c0_g1_i2:513-1523(-)
MEMCKNAVLFSEVRGNPVGANVTQGVAAYHAAGCDGVVAYGGGSALDAGKAIALMVGQEHDLWTYVDDENWDGAKVNVEGMAPVIAIPTTSGTGSEVGRASVITDERSKTKKIIFHPNMLPAKVILDPEVTAGLPAPITAAVGMDALSHCLEAYFSPLYHPMAQGVAVEGVKLIQDHLLSVVQDGDNLEARAHLQVASTAGATAFQKGLGAMHSLAHPLGAVHDTHHGLTNAVVMPYVLEFNRSAIQDVSADLARYLDLKEHSFNGLYEWVLELREQVGIPHTLKELGVEQEDVAALVPMAVNDPTAGTNPIKLTPENVEPLFRNCVDGVSASYKH